MEQGNVLGGRANRATEGAAQEQGTGQIPRTSAAEGGPKIDGSAPIPTHMLELFQKFIESMGNEDVVKEAKVPERIMEGCEQESKEIKMPQIEVPKSSAQGAARGLNTTIAPYCYRCLARGHLKKNARSLCFVISVRAQLMLRGDARF
jgi:hypothetical protein